MPGEKKLITDEYRAECRQYARQSTGKNNANWRAKAKRHIAKLYAAAVLEFGMDARKVRRFIGAGYEAYAGTPARLKWPYRAWCKELNRVMEQHKLREFQLTLFDVASV
jgi:hypothetical protein